jgi:hypothetical protein
MPTMTMTKEATAADADIHAGTANHSLYSVPG